MIRENSACQNLAFGQMTRRDFIRTATIAAGGAALLGSGCSVSGLLEKDTVALASTKKKKSFVGLEHVSHRVIDSINEVAMNKPKTTNKAILIDLIEASNISRLNKKVNPNYIFAYLEGTGSDFSSKSINRGAKDLSYLHYKNPEAPKSVILKKLGVSKEVRKNILQNYVGYQRAKDSISPSAKVLSLKFPMIQSAFVNDAYLAAGKNSGPAARVINTIIEESEKVNLKPNIVSAIVKNRSNFDPNAQKGQMKGLLLLSPKYYGDSLSDPRENLKKGLKSFSTLLEKYGNYKEAVYSFVLGEKTYKEGQYSKADKRSLDATLYSLRESGGNLQKRIVQSSSQSDISETKVVKRLRGKGFKKLIVLDPGHGGSDPGAVSSKKAGSLYEKNIVMNIANKMKKLLEKDYDVVLAREKDEHVTLGKRVRISNHADADYFVSLHCNAVGNKPHVSGTETLGLSKEALKDAAVVQKELIDTLGTVDRKAHYPFEFRPYVLRFTKCRSILAEFGFMTNDKEVKMLNKRTTQTKIAKAMTRAIKKIVT